MAGAASPYEFRGLHTAESLRSDTLGLCIWTDTHGCFTTQGAAQLNLRLTVAEQMIKTPCQWPRCFIFTVTSNFSNLSCFDNFLQRLAEHPISVIWKINFFASQTSEALQLFPSVNNSKILRSRLLSDINHHLPIFISWVSPRQQNIITQIKSVVELASEKVLPSVNGTI